MEKPWPIIVKFNPPPIVPCVFDRFVIIKSYLNCLSLFEFPFIIDFTVTLYVPALLESNWHATKSVERARIEQALLPT